VPLSYPAKGKISTSHQVKLYQAMNASARPKNIEQLPKILWQSITGKHNRIHGCQRFLTTIDCFSDMMSTILQKDDGATTTQINPKGVGICRRPLKSCNLLRNPMILVDGIQARTWRIKFISIQNQRSTAKAQGGCKETHIATTRTPTQ
jgi:hypothetical protein